MCTGQTKTQFKSLKYYKKIELFDLNNRQPEKNTSINSNSGARIKAVLRLKNHFR